MPGRDGIGRGGKYQRPIANWALHIALISKVAGRRAVGPVGLYYSVASVPIERDTYGRTGNWKGYM